MPHQRLPHPPAGAGGPTEELLAILAHELRRPLTAMLGALATLQQRHRALSVLQQHELLGIARRQGEQLGRLLDQLLAAADVDHGRARPVRRSLVDAAALAAEAGRAARLAHPDHPITIEAAGPLLVRADALAVSRILGNLLDNAATNSPQGATIWLSAGRDGVHALLAVQDQGPGIPPADRDRIFQRYARLYRPTVSPRGGLGLGLYVARRLATANRGRLRVADPPASGAPGLSCACPSHRRCHASAAPPSSRGHTASRTDSVASTPRHCRQSPPATAHKSWPDQLAGSAQRRRQANCPRSLPL